MMPMAHEKKKTHDHPSGNVPLLPTPHPMGHGPADVATRRIRSGQARQTQPNAPGHLLEWEQSRRRVVRGSLASLHDTIQLVES